MMTEVVVMAPSGDFTPVGDRARWRVLFDLLRKMDVGDLLTYEEMGKALDLHPATDRVTMQLAMRRATRELERVEYHTTDAVKNRGYRVVRTEEQLGLAKRHQRKASRALERGRDKVVYADLNGLPDETRRAFEVVVLAFAAQADYMKRMDVRQTNLEKAMEAVTGKVDQVDRSAEETSAEVTGLAERLARLEKKLSDGEQHP